MDIVVFVDNKQKKNNPKFCCTVAYRPVPVQQQTTNHRQKSGYTFVATFPTLSANKFTFIHRLIEAISNRMSFTQEESLTARLLEEGNKPESPATSTPRIEAAPRTSSVLLVQPIPNEGIPVVAEPSIPPDAQVIYVNRRRYSGRKPAYFLYPEELVAEEESATCALCGLFFSWIPLVGIFTYFWNFNAPVNSVRFYYARNALCVAVFVLILNVVLWPIMMY